MSSLQPANLKALEDERCRAMIRADMAVLDRLFSDKLVWTHSSGHVDSKQELLARIEGGTSQYLCICREDEKYVISADAAVASGIVNQQVRLGGIEHSLQSRYTNVWIREGAVWRVVAWQSTKASTDA
ncbi:nuclear transport factor 2 family protein [Allopusillimonas ginsengisoli]|uniref:nuclear transport factor 2 family protein n=1 Tax=Allopusillimonas ginsengisoli TaxID=453575 RepID=UPI001430998B|nr:nuclear transport factor 2 family protein [Allopusillimonas ginsengisoli]